MTTYNTSDNVSLELATPRIALGIEYDGSVFHGWQRQKHTNETVQYVVESALSNIAAEPIATIVAGRTDSGVHAYGQVLHFDTKALRTEREWCHGTNNELPDSVRVLWARAVPMSFNARRSAIGRYYRYVIYNHAMRPGLFRQHVSWYYKQLDVERMHAAAQHWIGEHDFAAFRASSCQSRTSVRKLRSIEICRREDFVIIDFKANAFLHNMVRNMVGVLMKIGCKEAEPFWAKEVLLSCDRREASLCAPSEGLYLMGVEYPKDMALPSISDHVDLLHLRQGLILA